LLTVGRIRLSIFIFLFEVSSEHAVCVGSNANIGLGVRPLPKNFMAFTLLKKGNIFVRYTPRPKSRIGKIKVPDSSE